MKFSTKHCSLFNRKHLFSLINDLPTIFEAVLEKNPVKDKSNADSGSKSRGSTKVNTYSVPHLICPLIEYELFTIQYFIILNLIYKFIYLEVTLKKYY